MAAPSPISANTDTATFTITANGTDVTTKYEVLSVDIDFALNRIPTARLVVRDGSAADESFTASASSDFKPGTQIGVQCGYHETNSPVFTGIVIKTSIQQPRSGSSTLVVSCRDAAVAMTIGRKSACYTDTTDSTVMSTLISNAGLSADVTSTSAQLEEITQYAATDWDFLLTRAEANGFVVNVADGKVAVAAPGFSASPSLSVVYGIDILEFNLEEDVRTQLSSVVCTSWDPATQAVVTTSQSARNDNPLGSDTSSELAKVTGSAPYQLNTPTPLANDALTAWAEAQLTKCSLAKIRGTVRFQGSALLKAGGTLELSGLGERFDGNAYVSAVHHELRDGDWTTLATVGLDANWFGARPDVSEPLAYGLLPGVRGLQIGTVKQINDDPAGQFRVLVLVPTIDSTGKGIWARLSRPYATSTAGFYFYPEVGDEVVLAFLDGDPRFAVIVGTLFSKSKAPPFTPDQPNNTKAIVTRSQLKVIFDEEKKVMTLSTPAGNTVVMSDDAKSITLTDQNSNSVKLGTDGITLDSASNITIKAAQNISVEASAGTLTEKGTQGVTVSGLKIALTADTEFSAAGNASASLQASGETTIKGAIVMIN